MQIESISLHEVYQHLVNVVGSQSYILSDCVTSVVSIKKDSSLSSQINTLAVDSKGTLYVSEEFIENHVPDNQALTVFLMHELLHAVLADTRFMDRIEKDDPERQIKMLAANIAFDCRINALLSIVYNKELNVDNVFRDLFNSFSNQGNPEPLQYLLYAGNEYLVDTHFGQEAKEIYNKFYKQGDIRDFYDLYEIVLNYLRQNKDKYQNSPKVILIGSHGEEGEDPPKDGQGNAIEVSPETAEAIGRAISEHIQEKELKNELGKDKKGGKQAGKGEKLVETFVPLLEKVEDRKIPVEFLKKLSIDSISKNIKLAATKRVAKWTTSPVIPQKFAKSDIMRVMLDMDILLWKHNRMTTIYDPTMVPIYFDVSGSMTSFIPTVLDLILNIDAKISHIWCFSDYVEKHTLDDLKARKIKTSGGTSFDAVLNHIEESNFSAALIITDGDCHVYRQKPDCLNDIVTLLTPHGNESNWFSKTFPDRTFDLNKLVGEVTK
jgi:predicted metal-dependent peptidase